MIKCSGCENKYPIGTKYCLGCGRVIDQVTIKTDHHLKSKINKERNEPKLLISEDMYNDLERDWILANEIRNKKINNFGIFFFGGILLGFISVISANIWGIVLVGIIWVLGFIYMFSGDAVSKGYKENHPGNKYTTDPKYDNIIK